MLLAIPSLLSIVNMATSGKSPEDSATASGSNAFPGRPINPYEPATYGSTPPSRRHEFTRRLFNLNDEAERPFFTRKRSVSRRRKSRVEENLAIPQLQHGEENKATNGETSGTLLGAMSRSVKGEEKLGTFSGVFVPTTLNVLSILMFLRFGFILGQSGVLGMMGK